MMSYPNDYGHQNIPHAIMQDGTTVLSEATGAGYASIVKTLILHGADVNQARTVVCRW